MRTLTSANLVFRTLPIQGYETIDGQDANVVDPSAIKSIVHATFYPATRSPAPASLVDPGAKQTPSPPVVIPSTGPQGGPVTAKNGIPCVN
jgi:hypothetical protein